MPAFSLWACVTKRTKRNLLIGAALFVVAGLLTVIGSGYVLARRFDPYIREQAIQYLTKRFDSDVELQSIRVSLPRISPIKLYFSRGRGAIATVNGEGVRLRYRRNRDFPPMFV